MRGPRANQGAVNGEVLIRKQAGTVSRDQNLAKQTLDGIVSNKAITTGWPRAIAEVLEDGENGLPGLMRQMLFQLSEELTQRDQQIGELDELIKQQCKADERIKRLPEIDGIGPISASAVVAAIGDAKQFTGSRDLSAWAVLTRGETYRPG